VGGRDFFLVGEAWVLAVRVGLDLRICGFPHPRQTLTIPLLMLKLVARYLLRRAPFFWPEEEEVDMRYHSP
jgi:hypothetical protein